MKKIVCIHLLNDYSGSPLVFSGAINGLVAAGHQVDLFVNKGSEGFLSGIAGVNYHAFNYSWSKSKAVTLFNLLLSQFILFIKLLRYWNQDVVIYVNTILPFGASLAGKMMGKKVVYHLHETSVKPLVLKKVLRSIAKLTASDVIYVSDYLYTSEAVNKKSHIVYNALSEDFLKHTLQFENKNIELKHVLMLCSLKVYKGVNEFISLAATLPLYNFTLVLNCDQQTIDAYMLGLKTTSNLKIVPAQKDVHLFYQHADLVLNLSHPDKWIETFGMTALEAMSYGIPVIVPNVGGISELVTDGFNGYKSDVRQLVVIKEQIEKIFNNRSLYNYLSGNARKRSKDFNISKFHKDILSVIVAN